MKEFRRLKLGILVLLAISVVGCGNGSAGTEINVPPTVTSPTVEVTPTPTLSAPAFKAAFTGMGLEEAAKSAPIVVLINNLAPARPQSGLSQADVIWEVLAEGGITRLVALFQSTVENEFNIGPVRSNRPYFIDLAGSYGAIIAHAGASNDAYAILQRQKKSYLDEISNAGSYFWRSKDRKAPHNLYTNLKKLREGANKKSYQTELYVTGYKFDEQDTEPQVGAIKQIEVNFQLKGYRVGYQYDDIKGTYLRSINDEPHIDKNNDEQISTTNLIFIQAEHKVLDNEGRLSVDLDSGGDALIINHGNTIEGNWIRAEDGMIRFLQNGMEISLAKGKSIIHILPKDKPITEHVIWE
ncbi:DUF3048 domain-containing protein [Paenibacillus endoradicis]|uniref:DUF3048 domain-containing protein n=1 Tax=Paenibacillus endoradicis TaxID=2972487 RepID=UPI002158D079|nr:DUF3048 domain-containing protein [Paenibacillus endoradicis]MCR8660166.1 DUF3048 domain-containing protein [Paenibacillus endoradicis]